MRELDLDACLAQKPADKPFWVEIEDEELFPEGGPRFRLQIPWREYRKHFRTFYKPIMNFGKTRIGGELQLQGDDFGFGLKMAEYIIKCEGIKGEFNLAKIIAWFREFPLTCEAFGNSLGGIFKQREQQALVYQEEAKKNSDSTPVG